jgi:hypothetical protein
MYLSTQEYLLGSPLSRRPSRIPQWRLRLEASRPAVPPSAIEPVQPRPGLVRQRAQRVV